MIKAIIKGEKTLSQDPEPEKILIIPSKTDIKKPREIIKLL